MLAVVGRPAGQKDQIEGGADAVGVVGVRVILGVKLARAKQDIASRRVAQAAGQRVPLAHGAQVVGKVRQAAIADILRQMVGDRQRQSGARQQRAKVADLGHGQDAGGQAARDLGLGAGQDVAQFLQAVAARTGGDEQSVGAQRAGALHDLADRVLGPVQRHGVHDQIMRAGFKVQFRRVGDDLGIGHGSAPEIRQAGDDGGGRKLSVNLCAPILDLVGDDSMQEIDRAKGVGAGAVAHQRRAVGQAWNRGGTVRHHGGAT